MTALNEGARESVAACSNQAALLLIDLIPCWSAPAETHPLVKSQFWTTNHMW